MSATLENCERALNSSLQMVVLAFLKIVLKDTRQVLRLEDAIRSLHG